MTAPSLAQLVNDPSLIARIPRQSIPSLRGELAALDSALLARLIHGAVEEEQQRKGTQRDRLLKVDEAAAKLGTTKDYLYRHASQLPFTARVGKALRFSEAGIEKYIREEAMNKRFR